MSNRQRYDDEVKDGIAAVMHALFQLRRIKEPISLPDLCDLLWKTERIREDIVRTQFWSFVRAGMVTLDSEFKARTWRD